MLPRVGLGSITKTNLRSACVRLVSLSQYGYHRALANGTTVRLTLNLDDGTVELSEAEGRVSLVRSDAPPREEAGATMTTAATQVQPSTRGRWPKPRSKSPSTSSSLPPSGFSAITSDNGKPLKRFAKHPWAMTSGSSR